MEEEKTTKEYKSRFAIKRSTVIKVKRSGYEIEEALDYFPNLIKEQQENEMKKNEMNNKESYYAATFAKVTNDLIKERSENRKLRKAITHLHPNDYWDIIKKVERGYYNYLEDRKEFNNEA